jgi:predicted nucleic acid-binding protein
MVSRYVFDTDVLSLLRLGYQPVADRIAASPLESLAVTVITVEEMLTGWQRLLRIGKTDEQIAAAYSSMASTVELLTNFTILR